MTCRVSARLSITQLELLAWRLSPPAAGQTTLPPDYRSSLSNVIATHWT